MSPLTWAVTPVSMLVCTPIDQLLTELLSGSAEEVKWMVHSRPTAARFLFSQFCSAWW